MRERDCGFLPVVDTHGIVVGVVTDRDICLAGAIKHRPLIRVSVKETMSHPVVACFADETLQAVGPEDDLRAPVRRGSHGLTSSRVAAGTSSPRSTGCRRFVGARPTTSERIAPRAST